MANKTVHAIFGVISNEYDPDVKEVRMLGVYSEIDPQYYAVVDAYRTMADIVNSNEGMTINIVIKRIETNKNISITIDDEDDIEKENNDDF